jgi:hypothetical protein
VEEDAEPLPGRVARSARGVDPGEPRGEEGSLGAQALVFVPEAGDLGKERAGAEEWAMARGWTGTCEACEAFVDEETAYEAWWKGRRALLCKGCLGELHFGIPPDTHSAVRGLDYPAASVAGVQAW